MKICQSCNKSFPIWYKENSSAKRINCSNRKFCLECQPLWSRLRGRTLDQAKAANKDRQPCGKCGKPLGLGQTKGSICVRCHHRHRGDKQTALFYNIVGLSCWHCGYDKGEKAIPILEFHHMVPEEKEFGINRRTMIAYSTDAIKAEMKKCCLLCNRCHREVEYGIISTDAIKSIYQNKWIEIEAVKRLDYLEAQAKAA